MGAPRAPCVCVCGRQWLQTLCEPPGARRPPPGARRPPPAHLGPPLEGQICAFPPAADGQTAGFRKKILDFDFFLIDKSGDGIFWGTNFSRRRSLDGSRVAKEPLEETLR